MNFSTRKKVRTVLENPTRYHVIQKQKNQVRQYLSESFQQSEWNEHQNMQQLQQHHQSKQEVIDSDDFLIQFVEKKNKTNANVWQ